MAINKDEIEKYIFDPENPKQCKSYKLLLRIANKENISFFSPSFLRYFFAKDLLDGDFKDDLWDLPDDYDSLSFDAKVKLYVEQLSKAELKEFQNNIKLDDIPSYNLFKYSFLNNFLDVQRSNILQQDDFVYIDRDGFLKYIKKEIFNTDMMWDIYHTYIKSSSSNNENYIFFSLKHFSILNSIIKKSSIFITLKENIDEYMQHENENVKPLFLKKIEDIDILLNVLEQDLRNDKHKNLPKEQISTLDKITIKNFFSIEDIKLTNLKDKKEIYIVGENGDGKTLLLQGITIALKGVEEGDVFNLVKPQNNYTFSAVDSEKKKYEYNSKDKYLNFFAYGAARNSNCNKQEDSSGYLTLFKEGYDLKSPKEVLTKRYSLDMYNDNLGKRNIITIEMMIQTIVSLLDRDIKIEVTPESVSYTERGADVSFNQLSAGYRGVITIVCDLITRLSENQPSIDKIEDLQGIVLIDEVELHLHPKWKYNFMKKLRDTFPLIQFIVTTHSPTVILGASKEAVFYKIYKEDGKVNISNQIANEGYTSNSLVSSPLFDMETITSRDYQKKVSSDDYIYEKIHQVIAQKIKEDINVNEEELLKMIDEELDKI